MRLETFDALERTRASLTVAITQAQLRLSRLDAKRSREEVARLYAVLDSALGAVRSIAREPARWRNPEVGRAPAREPE